MGKPKLAMGIVIEKGKVVKRTALPDFNNDVEWLLLREKMGCEDLTDEQKDILKAYHSIQERMEVSNG